MTLPFAIFDEFGQSCEDRVADHYSAVFAAQLRAAGEPLGYMNAGHVYELQQKRINYAYVYPNEEVGASVAIYAAAPTEAKPAQQDAVDAERYRFLRHADLDEMAVKYWPGGEVPEGAEFDAAVDAAKRQASVEPDDLTIAYMAGFADGKKARP